MVSFAIAGKRAGYGDFTNDPRLKKLLLYYAKTQTPRNVQRDNLRASGAWGRGTSADRIGVLAMAAFMSAKSDPDFSRTMQWMYASEGCPAPGADWRMGGFEAYAFDRSMPAQAPEWTSELFPNLGVFFRSAYNTPRESYLIFLSHTNDLRNLDVWTPGIGGFSQWFGRGKPLSTCFNIDTGYRARHELLRDGVLLARNWGAPGDPKGPFGYYVTTTPQAAALQPAADYARSTFSYVKPDNRDWFPDIVPPAYPRVTPATAPRLEWTRQVLFLKDPDPAVRPISSCATPHAAGSPPPGSSGRSRRRSARRSRPAICRLFWPTSPAPNSCRRASFPPAIAIPPSGNAIWMSSISSPVRAPLRATRSVMAEGISACPNTRICCTCSSPATAPTTWPSYPRPRGEAVPAFTTPADGKIIKVSGAFGTDYALLASEETSASCDGITISGTAAAVQQRGAETWLTLGTAGELHWQEYGLHAAMSASMHISPALLTLSLPSDSTGGRVTLTAPRLEGEIPGIRCASPGKRRRLSVNDSAGGDAGGVGAVRAAISAPLLPDPEDWPLGREIMPFDSSMRNASTVWKPTAVAHREESWQSGVHRREAKQLLVQTMKCPYLSTRSAMVIGFQTVLAFLPVPSYASFTE